MEQDTLMDHYTYLGNSEKGNGSEEGMVVFGFGRAPKATPLIKRIHNFRIGFYDGSIKAQQDHQRILNYINGL